MGNGKWGMGNGNGEWEMGNGEWEWGMGNGEWEVMRSKLPTPHSLYPTPHSSDYGGENYLEVRALAVAACASATPAPDEHRTTSWGVRMTRCAVREGAFSSIISISSRAA